MPAPAAQIAFDDFMKVDVRVGQVLAVDPFPEARKPAWKLTIDFGPDIGVKKSSAQITVHYSRDQLLGRKVAAVVNFPPRQIGKFMSEVLTLGFPDGEGEVVLVARVTDAVREGVVYSPKGTWLATSSTGQTVNALINADRKTDIMGGACYNDTFVEVALA
jgi:tRNA-binding protein